jgi:hypothetical protein
MEKKTTDLQMRKDELQRVLPNILSDLELRDALHDVVPRSLKIVSVGEGNTDQRLDGFDVFTLDLSHVRVVRQQRESGQGLNKSVSFESGAEKITNTVNHKCALPLTSGS